jgi:predicted nucleic acid-binding Zn finger protein
MQLITRKTKKSEIPTVLRKLQKKRESKLARQDKAAALVDAVLNDSQDHNLFFVPSQSDGNKVYDVVRINQKFGCSCPDFLCRDDVEACKHIHAVKLFLLQEQEAEEAEEKEKTLK